MSNELFGQNENNETSSANNDAFSFDNLMGIATNAFSHSEKAQEIVKEVTSLNERNPRGFPYKIVTLTPEWLDDEELLVLYLQAGDKVAVTPILFSSELVETNVRDSSDKMVRAANYRITRRVKGDDGKLSSPFLNYCIDDLVKENLINKPTSMDPSVVALAGCLNIRPDQDLTSQAILATAISELRAGLGGLLQTNQYKAQEQDLNYLNHSNLTNVVDLVAESYTKDCLGNNVFAPLKIRVSQSKKSALMGGEGTQLKARLEVSGYLDFRPLTNDEVQGYVANGKQAPFLVPQFVVTHVANKAKDGIVTPTMILDALAAISRYSGENISYLIDQSSQYSTTIDTACSTYDWPQVGRLIAIEAASRGIALQNFEPIEPVVLMTGKENVNVVQKQAAYMQAFGQLEILVDTPQAGEQANNLQQLFGNLARYHHKLTGKQNQVTRPLGAQEIIPMGTFTRISEKAQETRDAREKFNALGMIKMFHHGTSYSENFILGTQHAIGSKLSDSINADRGFLNRYKFLAETLFDDGSFKLTGECHRVLVTPEYIAGLVADLESNQIKYELRHSGAETIAKMTRVSATSASLNFNTY